MIVVAMSSNQTAWWITLAIGLVVALVVWGLLEVLRQTVNQVEQGVDEVWTMGKRVAQNTATTHTLSVTTERGVELGEELQQHVAASMRGDQ